MINKINQQAIFFYLHENVARLNTIVIILSNLIRGKPFHSIK